MQTPRTEFAQALKAIATERGLDSDVILETIKQAIIAAYKRDAREHGTEEEEFEGIEFDVELDPVNGEAKIFSWPEGKEDKKEDVTPPGFGRIAAQTAKQVIHQKIREAEKDAILGEYEDRVNSIISGMVLRFDGPVVRVDLGRTEGIMPPEERVPNERLNPNQRLAFLLKEIEETPRGKQLLLSRSDALFVQKLFEREVPELASGTVEVKAIARDPGVRTKMAVFSSQAGIDPVGSCVGQKGVRVKAVTDELGGERVDIIPWTEDAKEFISLSLAPAEGLEIKLDEDGKMAIVEADEDQLSMAIGKDGQNARLASEITGWKIEIKERPGSAKAKKTAEESDEAEEKKEVKEKTKTVKKTKKAKKIKKEKKTKSKKETPPSAKEEKVTEEDTKDSSD
ncbi:transcription termination factor NusA [Patescibacteria group bacterium]